MKESSLQHLLLFFSLASPIFSRSYPTPYTGYSADDETLINVFPEEYGAPPPHWPEGEEPVVVGELPLLLPYDEVPTGGGYGVPPLPQDTEGAEGVGDYYSNGLTDDSASPVRSDDGHSKFPDVESIPILGPEIIDGYGGAGDELYPTEELVANGYYTADGRLVWEQDEPYTTGEPPPFDGEDYDRAPGYGSDGYGEESPIWTSDEEQYGGAGYGGWFPEGGSAGSGVGYGIGELPNFEVVPKVVPGYGGYGGYGEETPVEMPEEPEPMGPLPGDGGYGGYGEETPVEMPEEPEPMGPLPGDGGYGTDNGGLEVDVEVPNIEGEEPGFPELFPELCDPNGNWDCILYRR